MFFSSALGIVLFGARATRHSLCTTATADFNLFEKVMADRAPSLPHGQMDVCII